MENLLLDIQEQETFRIISGEADWEITGKDEEPIRNAYTQKGAKIKVLAGPVISVDIRHGKDRTRGNPYLRLAKESALTLYPAPMRQMRHLRILGERKVRLENYHEGLAPKDARKGTVIENRDVSRKCAHDFDLDINAFKCKGIEGEFINGDKILCLTKDEISQIKEALKDPAISIDLLKIEASTYYAIMHVFHRPGRLYDFLTFDKTQALLREIEIFQPEMVLGFQA